MTSRRRVLTIAGIVAATLVVVGVALLVDPNDDDGAPTTSVSTLPSTATTTTTTASTTTTTVPPTTAGPGPTWIAPSATSTAPPGGPAIAIYHGDPNEPNVALTFDAGSDVGYAVEILDLLRANGITATFGMTGLWAEKHPELVARMADEGHVLMNHTYDHTSFTGHTTNEAPLTRAERIDQLARAEAAVLAASGRSTRPWFRPPYGDQDASVLADVGSVGYPYMVMWSVDSLGWKGIPAAQVTQRCLDAAEPGAIVLMHVGAASTDFEALQDIIDGVRARGLGFATVAELLD
jgi:peptidoglycan/xylan/chitin deacetylase (PgdA/CDA1 family)